MIGGHDYVFFVDPVADGFVQDLTWQFFRAAWPQGMVETDSTDALPLANSATWNEATRANELYFYDSAYAAKLWTELGGVKENHNTMVYVIFDAAGSDGIRVTAVVNEPTNAMLKLLDDLRTNLQVECRSLAEKA